MSHRSLSTFLRQATALDGSITPYVIPHVLAFGFIASCICLISDAIESRFQVAIALEVGPHEMAGAALALLLILRTNAGHDRWWEARKIWGGIVNQSRNLAITALSYGPPDVDWRRRMVKWAAAFPHIARASLRGQRPGSEVEALVGAEETGRLGASGHMPSFVAQKLAELLREAREKHGMDAFAFMQADKERAMLIDHIGACERILKTPLPLVYAIKIRRFILFFLVSLPFALLHKMNSQWAVPVVTMLVAYPLTSLDQIAVELQNPFALGNLSHLPLDDISATIERNVHGLLGAEESLKSVAPKSKVELGRAQLGA